MEVSSKNIEEGLLYHRIADEMKEVRAEFMYNYFDYDNDRSKVR